MVGVPMAKVANTLVSWLSWMADIYVGRLGTKNDFLEAGAPCVPRSCNTLVCLRLYRPGCMTFHGRCAFEALPAYSEQLWSYVGNEGLPEGCAPSGPAKYLWVLGCF
jgi:hypothetical protein